jgi:type IV secretion system protein VirB5
MHAHLKFRVLTALLVGIGAEQCQAQGIPVIDAANLVQTIIQAKNGITEITNQIQQIKQLQKQLDGAQGLRGLGKILNDPKLRNYVPAKAFDQLNAIDSEGAAGLIATAKTLRNAGMVYNCLDRKGDSRKTCQAALAQPYQYKGLLQDAMAAASGRLAQINGLMDEIDATADQKSIQEIQARISAENALLAHEVSQLQMLQGMADSDERIARSRERERQNEMLLRDTTLAKFLSSKAADKGL